LPKVVLDTSVIVEYIDRESEFQEQAAAIFAAILGGKLEALITHPTLSETYYVSAKIYEKLCVPSPQKLAAELVDWLVKVPSVTIVAGSEDLAIEAGSAKLGYCLALTDCYVLAASHVYGCKALFRKPEDEMRAKMKALKGAYQLVFLTDYK
jgi:predicted nucleic acid-binding protein